jgi:hypothetical protein
VLSLDDLGEEKEGGEEEEEFQGGGEIVQRLQAGRVFVRV